jgi:hypothetical protein
VVQYADAMEGWLKGALVVGVGVGFNPVLAACGSSSGTADTSGSPSAGASGAALSEADARDIGIDAYVFGYPW